MRNPRVPVAPPIRSRLPHILVIEDDPGCARALERRLRTDFRVTTCRSALEALSRFESTPPDALVVDFDLPDIRGTDIARVLLGSLIGPIPLVIVSAHDARDIPLDIEGAVFLEKPFDTERLRDLIESLLSGSDNLGTVGSQR